MEIQSFEEVQERTVRAITNSENRAHTAPLVSKLEILDIFQFNTLDTFKFVSLPQLSAASTLPQSDYDKQ